MEGRGETIQCRVCCFSLVTGLIKSLQSFLHKITHLVRSVWKVAGLRHKNQWMPPEAFLTPGAKVLDLVHSNSHDDQNYGVWEWEKGSCCPFVS